MPNHPPIQNGSQGADVKIAQERLHARMIHTGPIDGIFGPETEMAVKDYQMQRSNGYLAADFPLNSTGVVDASTWSRLDPDTLQRGSSGPLVKLLQELLEDSNYDAGKIDSDFGPKTERAVRMFQEDAGLRPPDGIVGPKTWAELRS
jgi:peptidoglycan hydrolase-like protein with peptidoglycan-binding domain